MTALIDLIQRHEGLRLKPYLDTVGKLTIGYGRNLEDNGISIGEALTMLANDIHKAEDAALQFCWYRDLTHNRRLVILSMIYNMGISGFKTFKRMIAAVEAKDYDLAAAEMLDSKWATQVKSRALELSEMMSKG